MIYNTALYINELIQKSYIKVTYVRKWHYLCTNLIYCFNFKCNLNSWKPRWWKLQQWKQNNKEMQKESIRYMCVWVSKGSSWYLCVCETSENIVNQLKILPLPPPSVTVTAGRVLAKRMGQKRTRDLGTRRCHYLFLLTSLWPLHVLRDFTAIDSNGFQNIEKYGGMWLVLQSI